MTATQNNFDLYSALSPKQRELFFPFAIGYMGDKLDPKAFAEAFVAFCTDPVYDYARS